MRTVRSSGRLLYRGWCKKSAKKMQKKCKKKQKKKNWGMSTSGVSAPGGCLLWGCVSAQGVSAPGEVSAPRGVSTLGGVCSQGRCVCSWGGEVSTLEGVSAPGGVYFGGDVCSWRGVCSRRCLLWGVVSQHALRQTPPMWTDRCL